MWNIEIYKKKKKLEKKEKQLRLSWYDYLWNISKLSKYREQ